ncbi:MAG: DUF881 domain-containing protein [Nocardioides sp.]
MVEARVGWRSEREDDRGPPAPLPPRVTMPLLTLITQQALDEDYEQAARQRAAAGTATPPRRRWMAAAAIAIFGVLASIAAVQASRDADVNDASRETLVGRITDRRGGVSALQDRIVELRETNAGRENFLASTTETQQSALTRLGRLQVRTGFVAVTGPGVRVTVDNAPNADPLQVVQDADLAMLVDGLWAAGAEAIAINGQRLTALSAIRNSGRPIEVNSVGVAPPYVVSAIGDPRALQADFFDSFGGLAFDALARRYGFDYDLDDAESLSLPAAPPRLLNLRSVRVGAADGQEPETPGEAQP